MGFPPSGTHESATATRKLSGHRARDVHHRWLQHPIETKTKLAAYPTPAAPLPPEHSISGRRLRGRFAASGEKRRPLSDQAKRQKTPGERAALPRAAPAALRCLHLGQGGPLARQTVTWDRSPRSKRASESSGAGDISPRHGGTPPGVSYSCRTTAARAFDFRAPPARPSDAATSIATDAPLPTPYRSTVFRPSRVIDFRMMFA